MYDNGQLMSQLQMISFTRLIRVIRVVSGNETIIRMTGCSRPVWYIKVRDITTTTTTTTIALFA